MKFGVFDDILGYVFVNEAAVNTLGYKRPAAILGQSFREKWNDTVIVEVIGVVQDFHVRSAIEEEKIGPMVLQNLPSIFQYANVKIASGDLRATIAGLEGKWKKLEVASESATEITGHGDTGYFRSWRDGARVYHLEGLHSPIPGPQSPVH